MKCCDVEQCLATAPEVPPTQGVGPLGAEVEAHIKTCPECHEKVEAVCCAKEAMASLDTLEPPKDLQQRVCETKAAPAPWLWVWRPALGLALAAGVGTLAVVWSTPPDPAETAGVQQAMHRVNEAHRAYLAAIGEMETAVADRSQDWPKSLRDTFDDNLGVINQAIAACQRAVDERGGHPRASRYLLAAYEEKTLLLRDALEWYPARSTGG